MRIVHVANNCEKFLGLRTYTVPHKINNGFIRNGHDVLLFSDRDVALTSSIFRNRKTGRGAANRKLIEVCRNFRPDLVAFCHADVIRPETVSEIRTILPGAAMFQYSLDGLRNPDHMPKITSKAGIVDRTFSTTAGSWLGKIAGPSSPAHFIPNPVDPSIESHRCHERTDQPIDVFFAGGLAAWADPDDLRRTGPAAIREHLPEVKCVFYGREQPPIWGAVFREEVGRSKIGLNLSHRTADSKPGPDGPIWLYSSDRVAQYMGNGLLTISTRVFALSELYGKDALVEASDAEELVDKVRFYAGNDAERQRIARNGYEVSHREFNERSVSQFMIETTLGEKFSHDYAWPTEAHAASADG